MARRRQKREKTALEYVLTAIICALILFLAGPFIRVFFLTLKMQGGQETKENSPSAAVSVESKALEVITIVEPKIIRKSLWQGNVTVKSLNSVTFYTDYTEENEARIVEPGEEIVIESKTKFSVDYESEATSKILYITDKGDMVSAKGQFYEPFAESLYLTENVAMLSLLESVGVSGELKKGDIISVIGKTFDDSFYVLADGGFIKDTYVSKLSYRPISKGMWVLNDCKTYPTAETTEDKVTTLKRGDPVLVTGEDYATGWYLLNDGSYVSSENLIEDRVIKADKVMYVIKMCNVRTGPSTDYETLGQIYATDKVHVTGVDIFTDWYQLDGKYYVGSSNLDTSFPNVYNCSGSSKTLNFEWTTFYTKTKCTWSLKINKELYNFYKGMRRTYDYSKAGDLYINNEDNLYFCQIVANAMTECFSKQGFTKEQIAQEACRFVQSLTYKSDKKSRGEAEYPKYPLETLYDKGGDCEDTAMLMAGVLECLGYKAGLLLFDNHCATCVAGSGFSGSYYTVNGLNYYYVESTGAGWPIGQIPEGYNEAKVYPIN